MSEKKRRARPMTPKKVADALRNSNGMVAAAARQLGCDRKVIYRMLEEHPKVREAREEAADYGLDVAQNKLREAVEEGQPWAIQLTLRTLGRGRGFVERQEHAIQGDVRTDIHINMVE